MQALPQWPAPCAAWLLRSISLSNPNTTARAALSSWVDQEFGEDAALWVAPELTDPVGSLEVGEHQDVEQLGAGSRTEGVWTGQDTSFEITWPHVALSHLGNWLTAGQFADEWCTRPYSIWPRGMHHGDATHKG